MRTKRDSPLARLATEQGGPVSIEQLRALGISPEAARHRVAAGRLVRIHRGVYAVGHGAMTPRGWLMAAVLAGGPGAVASHRSAAWLHGLLATNRARHDVTVKGHRRTRGIHFHRGVLGVGDVTIADGIPTTTVPRTLVDLADVVPERLVRRAVEQAEVRRVLDLGELEAVLVNGRRGTGVLRHILDAYGGPTVTRSELEDRMLVLIDAAGLPQPQVNAWVAGFEVDLHWPEHGLVVELDGVATRLTRRAFEQDRRRDAALTLAGYRIVRFTWRQVVHEPRHVTRILRGLLA
jgi:Transcriptional regulator, AbiEi antitoxin/Protein of unknown function (DUF559)